MTIKEKIFGIVTVSAIAFIVIQDGCHRREKDEIIKDVATYSDTAEYYRTREGVLISTNQSLVVENEKQLKAVTAKYGDTIQRMIKKFKSVFSVTVIKGGVEIKHDTIPMLVPIPCDFDPIKIRRDSAHYKFVGTVAKDYFSIDSLSIPNTQTIIVGQRKMGFLRKPETRAELINSNPLIQTSNLGSFTVKEKKQWYQRGILKVAAGVTLGYYIAKKL